MKLALVIALVSCSSPGPATPAPVGPAPVAGTSPLDLTVRVRAERAGKKFGVAMGDTLKSGDYLELFVDLTSPAYLYVVQFFPDGTSAVLFPDHGDQQVKPGNEIRIPNGSEAFQLDEHRGEEHLYVLASREPVGRVDAAIATQLDEIRTSGGTDAQPAVPPPPPPSPPPATAIDAGVAHNVTRPAVHHRPDHLLTLVTRNVKRVKRPDGEPAVVASAHEGLLVVRFSFEHE